MSEIIIKKEPSRAESVTVRRGTVGRAAAGVALAGVAAVGVAHEVGNQPEREHKQNVEYIKQRLEASAEFWEGAVETQPRAELLDSPSKQKDTLEGLEDNSSMFVAKDKVIKFPHGGLYVTGNDGNRYAVTIVPAEGTQGPVDFPRTIDDLAEHAKLVPYDDMFPGKDARNTEPMMLGPDLNNVLLGLPNDFEVFEQAAK